MKRPALFGEDDKLAANGEGASTGIELMTRGVPADSNLSSQWYLTGTWGIHANLVWPDYTGNGIRLADLDDGFQYTHPDLAPNYDTSLDRDFVNNDLDAMAGSADDHGTAVMGVMIADDNGTGTVGVAFDGTGVGIRMGFGPTDGLDEVLNGFKYALTAHVDVMNNSWGYTYPFDDSFASTDFTQIAAAVKALADQGRGGLGTSIVFAGGNAGDTGDNVNYHSFQNSPYTVAVAAIDSTGHAASFSDPGAALLVSAGGVNDYTTDKTGTAGYGSGNYVSVSGTSFAAPTVSGVVALMLEANPNLGWRDVQEILAYSAQKNDPTSSSWQYNDATNWNGGGLHFSHSYGFGAADAFTAVRLAETWTQQQTSANMASFTTATASPGLTIPDMSTVTTTMNVTQNINIEHVQVHLNISHTWGGDLVVTLIAPDGTQSVLVNRPGGSFTGDYSGGINFTFETNADWGESSAGTWTLKVQDASGMDSGRLNSWNMTFLGDAPSSDNLYVYTNEFGSFSSTGLATRAAINDTNGGTDTLNLAAVTSNSTINLAPGTGTIAGKAVTIAGIENVFTGDGADNVTGNASNNDIRTGRGNDMVTGSLGNDMLDGGAGSDTLSFLESVANFTFSFVGSAVVNITHAVGQAFTDAVHNFENFIFTDGSYTFAQLAAFDGGAGSTGGGVVTDPGTGTSTGGGTGGGTTSTLVQNGTAAADLLIGTSGNDTLYGLGANDKLYGNDGNDVLDGGLNSDSLAGGNGNDTYYVDATDRVIETALGGIDTVHSSKTWTLAANVENLVLEGSLAISGYGNGGANSLTGNGAVNILKGGDGNDTLNGGGGNDTLLGGHGTDVFVFQAGAGVDKVADFNLAQGDKLDVSDMLVGFDPLTDALSDFVRVTQAGTASTLSVDRDGTGTAYSFTQIATISNLTGQNEHTLDTTGHLITT